MLSNVLAVVPWVIDFIVDSGWAQEIVRSLYFVRAISSLPLKALTGMTAGHLERCEHPGWNGGHFLHLKTFSALLSRFLFVRFCP